MTSAPKSAERSPKKIAKDIVISWYGDDEKDARGNCDDFDIFVDDIAAAITEARTHQDLVKVLDNTRSTQWPSDSDIRDAFTAEN